MRKALLVPLLIACSLLSAKAQVVIFNENVKGQVCDVSVQVKDSLTKEAIPYASVYVIPRKDTTITNFTMTDTQGDAKLDGVPYGIYTLHVEMMGYRPLVKERYFRQNKVDMGTILLQVDEQFLRAAMVSDVGNPIVIKQDTVEFNASSFRVGANAMLKDLLRRMPGMEITPEGKVKFNGQEIDKLTVGGRTFFFNDQATALNNLPASVVDKIRVIDKESDKSKASGIKDGEVEKVLDVALKKEYQEGWFGNLGLDAGTSVDAGKAGDELRDDRGLLFKGNALVSAYDKKDQVTLIGNALNVDESGMVFIMRDEDGETSLLNQGLFTAAQTGVNVNSSRIKDNELNISADYKYNDTDSGSRTERTSFLEDGNLDTSTKNKGNLRTDQYKASVELNKEEGKLVYETSAYLFYKESDYHSESSSETTREGVFVNRARNDDGGHEKKTDMGVSGDFTLGEIFGREGRSINFSAGISSSRGNKQSLESSLLTTVSGEEDRRMRYEADNDSDQMSCSLSYSEPFGKKWKLAAEGYFSRRITDYSRDAFDDAGKNDYFSSVNHSDCLKQDYKLTAQYQIGKQHYLSFGAIAGGILNETFSKSFGVEETTGKGEWYWSLAPDISYQSRSGDNRIRFRARSRSYRPSIIKMLPTLNIANPSRPEIGNIYLKPYTEMFCYLNWDKSNKKDFSTIETYCSGEIVTRPVTQALWSDADGVMYGVPVNSKAPKYRLSMSIDYTKAFGESKLWSLSAYFYSRLSSELSYQATSSMPALDKENFDYGSFIDSFWGNAGGDRFYGGKSGMKESRNIQFTPAGSLKLKYNQERYSLLLSAFASLDASRYSLDPDANMDAIDLGLNLEGSYILPLDIELESSIGYNAYKGYALGMGEPEWIWDASISKTVGSFVLSIRGNDLLNQRRSLYHEATANYREDSYKLTLGRYVLFGLKWNFGKMNAVNSAKAQNAAWQMMW